MSYIREQQEEKVHDASKQMVANEPGQCESGHVYRRSCTISTSENRKQKGKDPQLGHTEMTSVQ